MMLRRFAQQVTFVFSLLAVFGLGVSAVLTPGGGQRVLAQATGYPAGTSGPTVTIGAATGYPSGNTATPRPTNTATQPGSPPTQPTAPSPTRTVTQPPGITASIQPTLPSTITGTIPSNRFLTEEAEMGKARVTPPASETARTPSTPTVTRTLPAGITPASQTKPPANPFRLNWAFFAIGFVVAGAAGAALWTVFFLLRRRGGTKSAAPVDSPDHPAQE